MKKYLVIFCYLLVVVSPDLLAAERYGHVVVKYGSLQLLRDGDFRNYYFAKNKEIAVFNGDILRIGAKSLANLNSLEGAAITLGSHAVFQIKSWKHRKIRGWARMIFGRILIKVKKFKKRRYFNLKTATATIGVKGTEFYLSVAAQGNTALFTKEGGVEIQGSSGKPQLVRADDMSVVLRGKQATPPASIPSDLVDLLGDANLDSPVISSKDAGVMFGEEAIVDAGIVLLKDLIQSKKKQKSKKEDQNLEGEQNQESKQNRPPAQSKKPAHIQDRVEVPEIEVDLHGAKINTIKRVRTKINFEK